jgi:cytochrome P450
MATRVIPDHVPKELIYDYDYTEATNHKADPHQALMELDENGVPEIFWSPLLKGYWVTRRYRHLFEIFRDTDNFGQYPSFIPRSEAWSEPLIPVEVDPPVHTRARRALGPLVTPTAVRRLEGTIRATAVDLIQKLADRTEVDFVNDYSRQYGPAIFLKLMGLPLDRGPEFQNLAKTLLLTTSDPNDQIEAGAKIREIIANMFDDKEKNPGDDWATKLLNAKNPDGTSAMSKKELGSMGFVLFIAGLDTVMNSLSFSFRYLAKRPEIRDKLRADRSAIPLAVEEMLRIYAVGNNVRNVRRDVTFNGVQMKKGDPVLMINAVANRDPEVFTDPQKIDLTRDNNLHLTFGAGIHRCAGSNLARMELCIAIEEWLSRIPEFHLKDGNEGLSIGGQGIGLLNLPLVLQRQ